MLLYKDLQRTNRVTRNEERHETARINPNKHPHTPNTRNPHPPQRNPPKPTTSKKYINLKTSKPKIPSPQPETQIPHIPYFGQGIKVSEVRHSATLPLAAIPPSMSANLAKPGWSLEGSTSRLMRCNADEASRIYRLNVTGNRISKFGFQPAGLKWEETIAARQGTTRCQLVVLYLYGSKRTQDLGTWVLDSSCEG